MEEDKQKILIVDDEKLNLNILVDILKNQYKTVVAKNGRQAIERATQSSSPPDLILLDVIMPDMNGFDVAKAIKQIQLTKDVPIIFITALESIEDKKIAFENGGNDYISKPFNNEEVKMRVDAQIKLKLIQEELRKKNEKMKKDLEIARKIQLSWLPGPNLSNQYVNIASYYSSMEELGGDYFDYYLLNEQHLYFVISDVSGHGVASSLITAMQKSMFNDFFQKRLDTGVIFENLNEMLNRIGGKEGYFFTSICGYLDLSNGILRYSNAGHPRMIIMNENSEPRFLPEGKADMFIGVFPNLNYRTLETPVRHGDRVILYTDGITEAADPEGHMYDEERLYQLIHSHFNKSSREIIDTVINDVFDHMNDHRQQDDLTMIVIDIL